MSTSRNAGIAPVVVAIVCVFAAAGRVAARIGTPAGATGEGDEIFADGFDPRAQVITFTTVAPAAQVGGPAYEVAASSTSGLPVALSIDAAAAGVCSISASSVSFQSAGTCIIDANQAGDADYQPAPQVQQSFAVARRDQTIAFTSTPSGAEVFGGPAYTVTATSTSGLPVTFSIDASAASVCSISGADVTFTAAGTCVVDASQAGDADWNAAPPAQQSFAVGRAAQTVTFTSAAPADALVGGSPYTVAAMASSGLPVAFTIDAAASSVCSVSGNSVTFGGAGSCIIDAEQAGDANWQAAPQVQQIFTVEQCLSPSLAQVKLDTMPGGAQFCIKNDTGTATEFTYLPINLDSADVPGLRVVASNIIAATTTITPPAGSESAAEGLAQEGDELAPDLPAPVPAVTSPAERRIDASMLMPSSVVQGGALVVGQLIDLNATVGGCNDAVDMRKGRVVAITTPQSPGQQVLYAVEEVTFNATSGTWSAAVPGGFATQDYQNIIDAFVAPSAAPPNAATPPGSSSLGTLLKTGAMDTFTADFGAPTDLDGNGGVIVFFTRKLNELAAPASSQIVSGSFQLHDLFNRASCPTSNEGEVLYMQMPDPTGSVNSNVRTQSSVYGNAVPTLVHHFAHLDNAVRRLYVNSAPLEETWLDEALAWEAQELVFFNASQGLQPRQNIVVTNLTTGPFASIRVADFNMYQNPIYSSMRDAFFKLTGTNDNARMGPLRTQGLAVAAADAHDTVWQSFAITSQFLRYALDRDARGDAVPLNALVNSGTTGMANLQGVFGANMLDWVRDFDVAVYTDDYVPNVAQQFTIPSWSYRSLYIALNGSYQLAVDGLADGTPLDFTLRYGGGTRYLRFGVAPGQTATISLTNGASTPTASIATALVRTK